MSKFNVVLIKAVRWSGWLLLPLILAFLLTGYIMDGRYGLDRLLHTVPWFSIVGVFVGFGAALAVVFFETK